MRKKKSHADSDIMSDINTTPLIDGMLVLLIMFIITIPVQLHSVKMNMPVVNSTPPTTPPVVVKIDINETGEVYWDGAAIAFGSALDQRLKSLSIMQDQPEVHLKPSKATEYRYVAAVMAAAQRIGVTKIGIVGNERFIP